MAAGVVSRDTAAAKEIVVSARNGFPWQASIGAGVEEFEFVKENQKVLVNGREFVGPVNVVRKATLGEISFVDLGADGQTSASVAAAATPSISRRRPTWTDDYRDQTPSNRYRPGHGRSRPAPATAPAAAAAGARPQPPAPRRPRSAPRPLAETKRIAADPRDLRRPVRGDRGPGDPRGLGRRRAASWRCCGTAARRRRPCTSATTAMLSAARCWRRPAC